MFLWEHVWRIWSWYHENAKSTMSNEVTITGPPFYFCGHTLTRYSNLKNSVVSWYLRLSRDLYVTLYDLIS
jgi:hypothetical protein